MYVLVLNMYILVLREKHIDMCVFVLIYVCIGIEYVYIGIERETYRYVSICIEY